MVKKYKISLLDKQFVRDHASSVGWDKSPPGPYLSRHVIDKTVELYGETARRLTGTNPLTG